MEIKTYDEQMQAEHIARIIEDCPCDDCTSCLLDGRTCKGYDTAKKIIKQGYGDVRKLEADNADLRERLDKAVDKTIVSEMLAKYFDCPCNFSPLDEEMWAYCRDNCVDDNIECWIRVINKKCAELKGEKK